MRRSEKTDESIARLRTEMRERCTKLEEQQYQFRYSQTQAREYDRRPAAAGVPPSHTIFGGGAEAPARGGGGDAAEAEGAGGDAMRQQQQQLMSTINVINDTVGLVHRELVTLTASMQGARDRPEARAARAAADGGARTESLHERVSAILQRRPAKRSEEEVTRGRSRQPRRDEHHFHPLVSSCFVGPSSRRGSASSMRGRPDDGAGAGEGETAGAPRREDEGVAGQHRLRQMKSAIRKLRRGADGQR